jgi:hypothetical protein
VVLGRPPGNDEPVGDLGVRQPVAQQRITSNWRPVRPALFDLVLCRGLRGTRIPSARIWSTTRRASGTAPSACAMLIASTSDWRETVLQMRRSSAVCATLRALTQEPLRR